MRYRMAATISVVFIALCSAGAGARFCQAEQLRPKTAEAFERYARMKETLSDRGIKDGKIFLQADALPEPEHSRAYTDLRRGEILIRRESSCGSACPEIPDGLVHDWTGTVFVRGISLASALATLQDYGRDSEYYGPEVVESRLLGRSGNAFRVFLRLKRVQVITAVFDSEHDIRYANLDATHATSVSRSTKIAEVESAGQPAERELPVGDDRGFLWRLYSYWRFYQADGGVYIQCNAISLTRDIPTGLGWVVRPFIEQIPQESLRFTLIATRKALLATTGASRATGATENISTTERSSQ